VAAREGITSLRETVRLLDHRPEPPVASQLERIVRFLEPAFVRLYRSAASRVRDVEQLAVLAGGARSRSAFLADLTLDPPASTGDLAGPPLLDEDWLVLSTIHSAKGCEWDEVHVLHTTDGNIPSDMATGDAEQIEEERRLLYVALTRARDGLFVHVPLRYHVGARPRSDRHSYAQVSRFLPASVRATFDERTTYTADEEAVLSGGHGGAAAPVEVDAFLADLWRE
jgi:DNA helicase-2/ATP-dependent DNA helicase PcrA